MTMLAFATERRAAAQRCSTALLGARAQQQTNRTPRLRSNGGTDRQTDGRSTVP